MDFSKVKLPTDRNFGLFLTTIILIGDSIAYYKSQINVCYFLSALAFIFFLISLAYSSVLHPLNKAWMRLGLVLGMIVSPVVLSIIYFLLFTPIALFMRLFGRDELKLKMKKYITLWSERNETIDPDSFTNQF